MLVLNGTSIKKRIMEGYFRDVVHIFDDVGGDDP